MMPVLALKMEIPGVCFGESQGMSQRKEGELSEMRRESKGKKEMRKSQRTNRVATEAAGGCAKLL